MEQKQITATYAEAVKAIKEAILESRYRAARLVNKEVLALYYAIGGYISVQSRAARWGSNAITNHYEILAQKKDVEQRLFYIVNCATGFLQSPPSELPKEYQGILPEPEELRKLM